MPSYPIRPLQLKILDILTSIDRVCETHNLRYYIIAGTLLGAVRHNGFIPWDDDIDIAMPRNDYDRLLAHAKEWLPAPLEAVAYETDATYPLPFAKIQDASTTLIERFHLRYLGGVYIDVFPLDGVPSNSFARRIHFMRHEFYKRALYFIYRDPYKHGHGASSWLPLLARKLFTPEYIQQHIHSLMTRHNYDESALVADYDDGLKGVFKRETFGTPVKLTFEGKQVCAPQEYIHYLTTKYGVDYMTPPPAPKQRQHNFHLLDMNTPYRQHETNNSSH